MGFPIYFPRTFQEVNSLFLEKLSADYEFYPTRSKKLFAARAQQIFVCGDRDENLRLSLKEFAEVAWTEQYPIPPVAKAKNTDGDNKDEDKDEDDEAGPYV